MIPGDLAARLRMLTEASFFSGEPNVAPLARVKAITDQLPAFTPGQRVIANLQTAYPGNTYQARIGGRDVTLALPQAANAGDTLELVVSHVTPRAVFATLAQPTTSTGTAAATPALSQTGRLISFLLTGQPAAQTAALNGGQPMLAAAPQGPGDSALLASRLSTALEQSGLFYESHQARWLAGKLDTAALMQEPQGRSPTPPATPAAAPGGTETIATPRAANEGLAPIP
ncbi:MAG: flagellar hook-length control protein FliK, partial [Zoogloea sp.]|nr:flagellar hook-length control protein FliK [Zoogloea sp.]